MQGTAHTAQAPAHATGDAALRLVPLPLAFAAALLLLVPGCSSRARGATAVPAFDLLRQFDHAERRPQQGHFEFREHTLGGVPRATLVVPAESRIIWQAFVPHRGRLQVFVAFPHEATGSVAVRVGISDNRIYNTVAEPTIATANRDGWVLVDADLSLYAGRKWSLFYRPDDIKWRIIIGTHVVSGTVPHVYLGAPALVTDVEGAREYLRRQTR